jgi:hypothetical protein
MANVVERRCESCGRSLRPDARSHARTCGRSACRMALSRQRFWPKGFEFAEQAQISQLRAKQADPLEALTRIVWAWPT